MVPRAILLCGIGGTGKSTAARDLYALLNQHGFRVELIVFDELRKSLAKQGEDPFTRKRLSKARIYSRAAKVFQDRIRTGEFLIIDSGLSVENIRKALKRRIPDLKIVHIYCPLWVAVLRDTLRSFRMSGHERGRFLHLRAILDRLNPLKKEKFGQPGITYPFEYPECADLHVNTFQKQPRRVAQEILEPLGFLTLQQGIERGEQYVNASSGSR